MTHSITFVLCSEPGNLERKSLVLCESIRKFGGAHANAEIISYSPRAGRDVSAETRAQFKDMQVTHVHEPLNAQFPNYPLANKVVSAADAEKRSSAEWVVFVDSDKLILGDLSPLLTSKSAFMARPVDKQNIAMRDFSDGEGEYWKAVYELLGVGDISHRVTTSVDQVPIYPYFNSGLAFARRDAGIFGNWLTNFTRIMEAGICPKVGSYFIEQSSLSATVLAMGVDFEVLPKHCNYPIHLHNQLPEQNRLHSLEEISTVHYHKIFERHFYDPWLKALEDFDLSSPKFAWWIEATRRHEIPASASDVLKFMALKTARQFKKNVLSMAGRA